MSGTRGGEEDEFVMGEKEQVTDCKQVNKRDTSDKTLDLESLGDDSWYGKQWESNNE